METNETIEKLVSYLPTFENELYAEGSGGGETFYADFVYDFFKIVERNFSNRDYAKQGVSELEELLKNDDYISTASIDQIKDLLTLCYRGERFSGGYWGWCIDEKRIKRILIRLSELNVEVEYMVKSENKGQYFKRLSQGE